MIQFALALEKPAWLAAGLFADHYLLKRLPTAGPELWPPEAEAREAFRAMVALWRDWSGRLGSASEEDCENYFIGPALTILGYGFLPRRRMPGTSARQYPDFLLFDSQTRADEAFRLGGDPYADCLTLLEAKRWGAALDRAPQPLQALPRPARPRCLPT